MNNDPDKRFYAPTTLQVRSWFARCNIPPEGRLKRLITMRSFNFILVVYFMTLSIAQALCTLELYDGGEWWRLWWRLWKNDCSRICGNIPVFAWKWGELWKGPVWIRFEPITFWILAGPSLPRGLRRSSSAARLLRLWARIPPGAWMFVVIVVCCQVEVSATDWSLVQRSPTDCVASLCVIKKPRKRGG